MKKFLMLFVAALMMVSCTKQSTEVKPDDPMKGWTSNLKYVNGTPNQLIAGRYINVGDVTYEFDAVNQTFNVTYNCGASGWKVYEAHVYAGLIKNMPVTNKKNPNPKVGNFPAHGYYSGGQTVVTVSLPMTIIPDAEEGFVVAAHAVVKRNNQEETAWAYCPENSKPFTDKNWGWYDPYTYDEEPDPQTIIYGVTYSNDSLKLYHINLTSGGASMILREYVGNRAGTYDGAAYDYDNGMFFFTNYDTKELWVNNMLDEYPSFEAGVLNGTAASGTFHNGGYYYVNEDAGTINLVTFDQNWQINGETTLSTIPDNVTVNDIAMAPDGNYLYMVGNVDGGGTEMLTWNVTTNTYYSMALTVNEGVQIAYGSDGLLYAVAPTFAGGIHSTTYIVDTSTGTLTEIDDDGIIIIDDPFSDISRGPIM
jgi:hypothetical protein